MEDTVLTSFRSKTLLSRLYHRVQHSALLSLVNWSCWTRSSMMMMQEHRALLTLLLEHSTIKHMYTDSSGNIFKSSEHASLCSA